jgi:alpha-L-fucosidase
LTGFTYLPMQARYPSGYIAEYAFEVSQDGKIWKEVARGEFSNIKNSPVEQVIRITPISANWVKLKALKTTDGNPATFGEFGILTR